MKNSLSSSITGKSPQWTRQNYLSGNSKTKRPSHHELLITGNRRVKRQLSVLYAILLALTTLQLLGLL